MSNLARPQWTVLVMAAVSFEPFTTAVTRGNHRTQEMAERHAQRIRDRADAEGQYVDVYVLPHVDARADVNEVVHEVCER